MVYKPVCVSVLECVCVFVLGEVEILCFFSFDLLLQYMLLKDQNDNVITSTKSLHYMQKFLCYTPNVFISGCYIISFYDTCYYCIISSYYMISFYMQSNGRDLLCLFTSVCFWWEEEDLQVTSWL